MIAAVRLHRYTARTACCSPAVITLIAQGSTGWALFLALWSMILVAGSDNVIRPLIISGSSNASTLLVFVGLLGGINFFDFAGIFMGPLVATLLQYADSELPTGLEKTTLDAITQPPSAPEPTKEEAPPSKAETRWTSSQGEPSMVQTRLWMVIGVCAASCGAFESRDRELEELLRPQLEPEIGNSSAPVGRGTSLSQVVFRCHDPDS